MALTSTFEKTRKGIENKLSDATPLYFIAGASDFAVEKLRGARAELNNRVESFDPKALRDQAQSTIVSGVGAIQGEIKAGPAKAQAIPGKAQAAFGDAVHVATTTAVTAYEDLAGRGKSLVTRVRRQPSTVELEEQLDTTASKVKAATTTAKKSAAATKKSVKGTTTTAKKSAAKTRSAAKGATTSAKKTATATKKAAADAADKVGD